MQQIYLFPSLDIAGLGLIGLTVEEENVHVGGELNRLVDSPNVIDFVDITKHIYRVSQKNCIWWKNGHNYLQTHPKCKKWGCFGKFRIFATS